MSGFRDPYAATSGAPYGQHNYNDSMNYNYPSNNYGSGGSYDYGYNPYSQPQQPLGRANTTATTASRYTSESDPRNRVRASENTLPPVPQMEEPEEDFSTPPNHDKRASNVLRKGSTRNPYGAPLERDVTRQSLTPLTRPPASGSARDIKRWRSDHHGNQWTRGSRVGCVGRFFCCTIMVALLLIISIVLTLVMFVRPPNISFTGIQAAQDGRPVFETPSSGEFKVNLGFGVNVTNPNYFSATFTSIKADIFYPINKTPVGGGNKSGITFNAHSNKAFEFPLSFVYDKDKDTQNAVITDLANRCGFIDPSTKKDISIDYTITLRLKALVASVGPSFSGTANFECPLQKEQVEPFLKGLGINVPGLG